MLWTVAAVHIGLAFLLNSRFFSSQADDVFVSCWHLKHWGTRQCNFEILWYSIVFVSCLKSLEENCQKTLKGRDKNGKLTHVIRMYDE
jgi:hypothetical protein